MYTFQYIPNRLESSFLSTLSEYLKDINMAYNGNPMFNVEDIKNPTDDELKYYGMCNPMYVNPRTPLNTNNIDATVTFSYEPGATFPRLIKLNEGDIAKSFAFEVQFNISIQEVETNDNIRTFKLNSINHVSEIKNKRETSWIHSNTTHWVSIGV